VLIYLKDCLILDVFIEIHTLYRTLIAGLLGTDIGLLTEKNNTISTSNFIFHQNTFLCKITFKKIFFYIEMF